MNSVVTAAHDDRQGVVFVGGNGENLRFAVTLGEMDAVVEAAYYDRQGSVFVGGDGRI